jgi:hypothetical protein
MLTERKEKFTIKVIAVAFKSNFLHRANKKLKFREILFREKILGCQTEKQQGCRKFRSNQ